MRIFNKKERSQDWHLANSDKICDIALFHFRRKGSDQTEGGVGLQKTLLAKPFSSHHKITSSHQNHTNHITINQSINHIKIMSSWENHFHYITKSQCLNSSGRIKVCVHGELLVKKKKEIKEQTLVEFEVVFVSVWKYICLNFNMGLCQF